MTRYRAIATLKTAAAFRQYLAEGGIVLPFDDVLLKGSDSPLAQPLHRASGVIGNRFAILPMEGWDGTTDGRPTELTRRRWRNFGLSGAKLIWGGEAVAVRQDGRANPNQLLIHERTLAEIASLRGVLVSAHRESFGSAADNDLLIGLQLTHSGRFARPTDRKTPEPRIVYRHPALDDRVKANEASVLSDGEIHRLIDDFVRAACLAQKAGFRFVDVKHCHGYLGHEFLSAVDRPGEFGGALSNRITFLRRIIQGIRAEAPGLEVAVRFSLFDFVPFEAGAQNIGEPVAAAHPYRFAFGGDDTGVGIDLAESSAFCTALTELGVSLIGATAGSRYYNPHIQRPAAFPPSDGYQPPEDPLVGVARQIAATAALKRLHPRLMFVGSAYSYLQQWLPHVGQRALIDGGVDFVGLGRMVLSYPELPADVLAGRPLQHKRICRTFSDCTTAARIGLISGCFPLDPHYRQLPEAQELKAFKAATGNQSATPHNE